MYTPPIDLPKKVISSSKHIKNECDKKDKDDSIDISMDSFTEIKVKKNSLIRRRSCLCKWCGGVSKYEMKHQDIVSDLQTLGRNGDKKLEDNQNSQEIDQKNNAKLRCNDISFFIYNLI